MLYFEEQTLKVQTWLKTAKTNEILPSQKKKKDVTRTYLKSDVCYLGVIIKMYVQAGSLRLHMSSYVLLLLL